MKLIYNNKTYPLIEEVKPITYQTTKSGYGSKLPTRYTVKIEGRTHRVYAICYSNAASFFIVKNRKNEFVNLY